MKSAKQWKLETGVSSIVAQQIQLDAMKEGMRRAAEVGYKESTDVTKSMTPNALGTMLVLSTGGVGKKAILSAAEQLTVNDLCPTNNKKSAN